LDTNKRNFEAFGAAEGFLLRLTTET